MTTVKGGGWAHLSCVFWHEKPSFENILNVLHPTPSPACSCTLQLNQAAC